MTAMVEMTERAAPLTAGVLVIGNEILTGKVQDCNAHYLCTELRALGVSMRRIVVVPDEIDTIVAEVRALSAAHDIVFTSGGVGPTHDDVTLPAIAKAFDRTLVRAPEIERLIRGYHGERTTEDHLRMADVPQGARLIASSEVPWPTVAVDNVYVLPGVPEIFRMKFGALRDELRGGKSFVSAAVYTQCDEGEIAAQLAAVAARYPDMNVGSYPRFRSTEYKLKLTVDGEDETRVRAAITDILAFIPRDKLVRSE
jgi:molybdenum cofactor synthesis domain-containing protein